MADRSFEQQVHEELAGLRIKPDDAVWTHIEAALQKEKKRRFLWVFFLLAGLLGTTLLAYLHWYTNSGVNNANHPVVSTSSKNNSKNISTDKNAQKIDLITQSNPVDTNEMKKTEANQDVKISIPSKIEKGKEIVNEFRNREKKKNNNTIRNEIVSSNKNDQKNNLIETNRTSSNALIIAGTDQQKKELEKEIEKPEPKKEILRDDIQKTDSITSLSTSDLLKSDSTDTKTKTNPPAKKNWQWGIHAAFGESNTIDGFSLSNKSALAASSITAPGGISQTPSNSSSPVIKGAFSFQAGAEVSKQIGKKNRLAISINYQLFQNQIQTGNRIDSTAFIASYAVYNNNRYFYSTGSSHTYTSYYHVVAAGAGLYFPRKIFHSVPVRWNVGLNMQLLIATNGLLYDPASATLFQNNALLAKLQPQVFAGFDIGMGKSSPLYIGPSLQYTLSKLSSTGAADNHLFFAGVRVSFIFPEKKKKMQR